MLIFSRNRIKFAIVNTKAKAFLFFFNEKNEKRKKSLAFNNKAFV
jgi:hypothetical protein